MKKPIKILLLALVILIAISFLLFFIRLISPSELDDLSPKIPCSSDLVEKSDILWIIPLFNNKSIADNQEWCSQILTQNKTLGLHGVFHAYNEFKNPASQESLSQGISAFKTCFGFPPVLFKPPQLAFNKSNLHLLRQNNLTLKTNFNQIIHKVYHCSDSGKFPNKVIDLF